MKKIKFVPYLGLVVALTLLISNPSYALSIKIPKELRSIYAEYKNDTQFKLMLEDYGEDYAESFLWDVYNERNKISVKGGGGNICYQYVTNICQTTGSNCGPTTVLQSLYGMGSQGKVSGTTDAQKIQNIMNSYQESMMVYQIRDALNTYKPNGIGNYTYATGSSMTLNGFEEKVANSLTYCKPVVLHAKTKSLSYYNNANYYHYISLDYINRSTHQVRLVDCHYNASYRGAHYVNSSEAYGCITPSGETRYLIY